MDNLAGVVVADKEYPPRVAFSLVAQVLDDFQVKFNKNVWSIAKPLGE